MERFWPSDVEIEIGEMAFSEKTNPLKKKDDDKKQSSFQMLRETELVDANGDRKAIGEVMQDRSVVLLINGLDCKHCFDQVVVFGQEIPKGKLICIAAAKSNRKQDVVPSTNIFVDEQYQIFKALECFDKFPLHGTFVVDGNAGLIFKKIGKSPYMNAELVKDIISS